MKKIDITTASQKEVGNLIATCEKNGVNWTYKKINEKWWFFINPAMPRVGIKNRSINLLDKPNGRLQRKNKANAFSLFRYIGQ